MAALPASTAGPSAPASMRVEEEAAAGAGANSTATLVDVLFDHVYLAVDSQICDYDRGDQRHCRVRRVHNPSSRVFTVTAGGASSPHEPELSPPLVNWLS